MYTRKHTPTPTRAHTEIRYADGVSVVVYNGGEVLVLWEGQGIDEDRS